MADKKLSDIVKELKELADKLPTSRDFKAAVIGGKKVMVFKPPPIFTPQPKPPLEDLDPFSFGGYSDNE